MAIESNPFGPTVLSGGDAERFLRHIREDGPNPRAIEAYKRGKALLAEVLSGSKIRCAAPLTTSCSDSTRPAAPAPTTA